MLLLIFLLPLLSLTHRCEAQADLRGVGQDDVLQQLLHKTRKLAQESFDEEETSSNADILAVIVLVTDFDRKNRDRLEILRTSLQLCMLNLFSFTPSKFYVFTFESQVADLQERLGELMLPNVAVLPVFNSTWTVPLLAGNQSHWHSHHTTDYRIMGDWRLGFMPQFARQMGHRYVMQLDDDSYILGPVAVNLVQLFDRHGYLLGARKIQCDPLAVTWGLPELARFFLLTQKIVPETLFEFCDPPNIDGLYSEYKRTKLQEGRVPRDQLDRLDRLELRNRGGWNRTVMFGNCLMYSLDWFFRPEVYHFVQLCRTTGSSFVYRWNEQGVLAMLWQIFVPRDKFAMLNFEYAHRINSTLALQLAADVAKN